MNLRHPCIATPIGFLIPGESSISHELKIVQLFSKNGSLAEVLSNNPVWWTPTAKARTVAAMVFGLRFAHSFGLLHNKLNPNNILFDIDHRIQLTDFGSN
jgi:serine/threonine protein kinase